MASKKSQDSIQSRTTFTFVREPLGRFISGYAEIDRIYLGPRYEFFHQAEEGSVKRAQLFVERFFQDGLIFNGHVKPQSEAWQSCDMARVCDKRLWYFRKIWRG